MWRLLSWLLGPRRMSWNIPAIATSICGCSRCSDAILISVTCRDLWFICVRITGHESSDSQPEIIVGVHKTINVSYSMFIDNMGVTHVPNSDSYLGGYESWYIHGISHFQTPRMSWIKPIPVASPCCFNWLPHSRSGGSGVSGPCDVVRHSGFGAPQKWWEFNWFFW